MAQQEETQTARWKLVLAYGAFSLVAFGVCLLLTFPYDTLRARAVGAAADAGYALRIGSLRPGLRGLTATRVSLSKVPNGVTPELLGMLTSNAAVLPGPEELGEPLTVDSVAVRPALFPLGVAFHANLLGGSLSGSVGGLSDVKVAVKLANLDPSAGNLKGFSGMDVVGKLNGTLDLTLPRTRGQPDLSLATGQLSLDSRGLIIQGGNIAVPLMPGQPPSPMDLPRIAVGDLDARLNIDKGLGTVETLQSKSEDLEMQGSGTIKLGQRVDMSQPDMDIKLGAEPEFIKRLGPLSLGLNFLTADRSNPKFRVGHLGGFFNRPSFLPARAQPQMR